MRSISFKLNVATALAVLALSACGGGGDDAGTPGGGGTFSGDAIDRYNVDMRGRCQLGSSVRASDGTQLYERLDRKTPVKVSATKVSHTLTMNFFITSDCSGTALGSIERTNAAYNTITHDGQKQVGSDTVDKLTLGQGVWYPGISGATVTINGIRLSPTLSSQSPTTAKDIWLIQDRVIYTSALNSTLDADGYQTSLDKTKAGARL